MRYHDLSVIDDDDDDDIYHAKMLLELNRSNTVSCFTRLTQHVRRVHSSYRNLRALLSHISTKVLCRWMLGVNVASFG